MQNVTQHETNPTVGESTRPEVTTLAARLGSALAAAQNQSEFLQIVARLTRDHHDAWMAVAALPHDPDTFSVDATPDGRLIDAELLRLQFSKSAGAPSAVTLRLADGRNARAIQATAGSGEWMVGIGVVFAPQHGPDGLDLLEALRSLSSASHAAHDWWAIHRTNCMETALPGIYKPLAAPELQRDRLRAFHHSLDTVASARAIAAESATMVGCDRVCVLIREAKHFRLRAVTGVDVIDRRGNESAKLESLANAAYATGDPLVYPAKVEMPPQLEVPVAEYLDQSLVHSGILIPVYRRKGSRQDEPRQQDAVVAMIAFERFAGEPIEAVDPSMNPIIEEAAIALSNAKDHESLFLLPLWRMLGKWTAPAMRRKVISFGALAAALLLAGFLIPVEHTVIATGVIEPSRQQEIFASSDSVVSRLYVNDGDIVKQGDLLVELENADLLRQKEQITGEIATALEKLAATNASLLSNRNATKEDRDGHSLEIERRQLESQLEGLRAQAAVIDAERERHRVRSPMDGQVIGWRLKQRLDQRPVTRGHRLFTVADTSSGRILRLQVHDRDTADLVTYASRIAPSQAADQRQADQSLRASFVITTSPDMTHQATITRIATATHVDAMGVNVLEVLASVDGDMTDAKAGSEVTASIRCGRRSFIASWFGDVNKFYHRYIGIYMPFGW